MRLKVNCIASRHKDAQLNKNNRKAYKLASLLIAQCKNITEVSRELNENGYKKPMANYGRQFKFKN